MKSPLRRPSIAIFPRQPSTLDAISAAAPS